MPKVLGVPQYLSTWATVPVEADVTTWAVLRALRLRLRLSTSAVLRRPEPPLLCSSWPGGGAEIRQAKSQFRIILLHQPHINLGPLGSIKSYCASKVLITPRKSALAYSVGDDQPDFESVQSFSGSLARRSGRLSAAAASRAFTAFFP